ncbi:MAG: hypothetical protein M1133_07365 [Armatimonadetes bacterium]|nr:hypothetical protein [Armatimonadota bacterium]
MSKVGLCLLIIACALALAGGAYAVGGKTVTGTLVAAPGDNGSLVLQTDTETVAIQPGVGAKIVRGQVGMDSRRVNIRELAPGDHVIATLGPNGRAGLIKALFGIVKGDLAGTQGGRLRLQDGREVPLNDKAQVVLLDGRIGKISELKTGTLLICRVNPSTNEAWTVLAATTDKTAHSNPSAEINKVTPVTVPPLPSKPKIKSITYTAPATLKPGDVITIDLAGTPNAKASFEVRYFMPAVPMKEVSPGLYRGQLRIPTDKSVCNAPVVGYLTASGAKASPVQAAKLITIGVAAEPVRAQAEATTLKRTESQTPIVVPAVQVPSAPPRVVVPVVKLDTTPEPPKPAPMKKIAITMPPDGAKIQRALTIKGEATPDSKVTITVTYSNGLTGLLKLAGPVASQAVAVGNNGEFRMGPIPLEGTLATKGLIFTVKVYYPDQDDHGTATITVIGDRG